MTVSGRRWAVVGALLALAAIVRVSAMFYGSLSGEDATVALAAKHILSGENFPAFFYRQTYMGSLNGIHLVPALYLFGPSVLLVRLNAIAWSLLFPLGLYLLTRRIFDERAGRAALALAAVPPYLLTYWSTVAEPHFETNVFGVWALLLALTALTARSEPARTRALAVFGLLSGLAVWTNPKAAVFIGPALLLLVLSGPRLLLGRGGALLAGGLVLGSSPAWLFYLLHGKDRAGAGAGSVRHILGVDVQLSLEHLREFWSEVVLALLGTYYWKPEAPQRRAALAVNSSIYVIGVGFAVYQLARLRRVRPPSARAWGLGLLLLTLATSLGAVYFSSLASGLLSHASRYALPAYIPLLACVGALAAWIGRRSRPAGAALLAFLLLFAVWTHERFIWPISPTLRARESAARAARETIIARLAARPVDALYVDTTLGAPMWAFLLDHPAVSAVTSDVYLPHAVPADAAERIAIVASVDPSDITASLATLGATAERTAIRRWRLFEDIRVPARGYRMVPRGGWRVSGDPRAPASVADGDIVTAWPYPSTGIPIEPLVLDLGRPYDLARVILWPSVPTSELYPLQLSGSTDGSRWEPLGEVPAEARMPAFVAGGRPVFRPRNGWLELALAPRSLRYLRLEPADHARWGVSEIQVYETAAGPPPGRVDVGELVERLRAQGLDRLLADPVTSARVARATQGAVSTLVANGVVDNHGAAPPELLARPVRLRARDALLVPIEDLHDLRQRLESAGVRYTAEPLGDHALLRIAAPLAATDSCRVPTRRTTTQEPATDGGSPRVILEATLGEETLVSGMRLFHPPDPSSPLRIVEIAASRDGRAWRPITGAQVPEYAWAGRTLFAASDGLTEVALDPTPARHLRVVTTSRAGETRLLCVRATRVSSR